MSNSWPHGKGPIVGRCGYCGGDVRIKWSCRVAKEIVCTECGCINPPRRIVKLARNENVRALVDMVYNSISSKCTEVKWHSFISVVNVLIKEQHKRSIDVVSREEFRRWGYEIDRDIIKKVK